MRKRVLSLATILAVMVVMLLPAPVMAASGGGPLVKQVNVYIYNSANKWEQYGTYNYAYKDSYPIMYTEAEYSYEVMHSMEYKMKKGLPVSAKHFNAAGRKDTKMTYDKKGCLTKSVYGGLFNKRKITRKYSYNKQGFVTKYNFTDVEKCPGIKPDSVWKGKYEYKYTMSKGLPKTMSTTYTDTYGSGTEVYKYVTTYNSKGLIESMVDANTDGTENTVKYTYKKGKVTQAVIYYKDGTGNTTPYKKITFKYSGGNVKKTRYVNMINSFVAGDSYYFGVYNWF